MEDEIPTKATDLGSANHCVLVSETHRLASRIWLEFSKGLDLHAPILVLLVMVKVNVAKMITHYILT